MRIHEKSTFAAALWVGGLALGQPAFQGLGHLPGGFPESGAYEVSRDGTTVVGYAATSLGYVAFRWTAATGMVGLGDFAGGGSDGSFASGVSDDGTVVAGWGTDGTQGSVAFRWTQATGLVSLGDIDADPGTSSFANDASADGTVIAMQGGYRGVGDAGQAVRWTLADGLTPLGHLAGGNFSFANAVSADGAVLVGGSTIAGGGTHAFRWTEAGGMVSLGDLAGGGEYSYAQDVSSDGSVIVGRCTTAEGRFAMRWTQAGGMVSLGDLPGGPEASWAIAVSDDGGTIVGVANSTYEFDFDGDAFIWTADRGMRYLKDVLMVESCASALEGWRLVSAWGVSADGRTIVGEGINPQGNWEAYIARLGPRPCAADFNRDGQVDFFDYLDFVSAYSQGCE